MKIGLIGHSHSVCLMDALGKWRDQLGRESTLARAGFSNSFDGWDALDTSQKLIRLPNRRIGKFNADLVCAVIFGRSNDYELVAAQVGADKSVTIIPSPTIVRVCEAFADCDLIVSIVFGNELARCIWIDDLPAYDFVEDSVPGPLRAGSQPIDRRYIGQSLREYVGRVQMTCLMIRRLCPRAAIAHMMPPPPIEDPSRIQLLEGFAEAIGKWGALDATLRLKWYRAYTRTMKTLLDQGGIALVPPPVQALTEKGFLREYLANGLTHGSPKYGEMVWDAIASNIKVAPAQ